MVVLGVVVLVMIATLDDGNRGSHAASPRSSTITAAVEDQLTASATPSLQAPAPETMSSATPGVPVQVAMPRLQISSRLEPLGLLKNGSLEPPSRYGRAGWYDRGPRPGQTGPAVIAGHVDSTRGPAIFFYLYRARIGDEITVRDSAGRVRRFTVTAIHRYRKASFPTAAVYGPTAQPVLRLVTCTGAFDVSKRSYVDNLVVFADLVRPRAG